jgi:hypothetical protein
MDVSVVDVIVSVSMSRLTTGASRIWSWVALNKDQLEVGLSLLAIVLSVIAILDARNTQTRSERTEEKQNNLNRQIEKAQLTLDEQLGKAQLQPIFLVNEIPDMSADIVYDLVRTGGTALRIVNQGHEVSCIRVRSVTIVPAIFPALALDDLTGAARLPSTSLEGNFGISDYYPIEHPQKCLSKVTGVLLDIPQTRSEWMDLAYRNFNILSYFRGYDRVSRDAADMESFVVGDPNAVQRIVKQWSKLAPLAGLLPSATRSFVATYVEISYRDVLDKDHSIYFKLPGDGRPIDSQVGSRCFELFDQLNDERLGRSMSALSPPPDFEVLQRMSEDKSTSTGSFCY